MITITRFSACTALVLAWLILPTQLLANFNQTKLAQPNDYFFSVQNKVDIAADGLNSRLPELLNLPEESSVTYLRFINDDLGYTHTTWQQTYQNYPIELAEFKTHHKNGKLVSVNGRFYNKAVLQNITIKRNVDESEAFRKAVKQFGAATFIWDNPSKVEIYRRIYGKSYNEELKPAGKLVLYPIQNDKGQSAFHLAYKYDINSVKPIGRKIIFISAVNGNVLEVREQFHTSDVTGTAETRYSGTQSITTDSLGPNSYRLRSEGVNGSVETYNLNKSFDVSDITDFEDSDNYWNNVNTNQDEVATDAHWGAEKSIEYFKVKHNRSGIDNNNLNVISLVHYGDGHNNASWNGQFMIYGDGDGSFTQPFTALDVCGHELTHGVTEFGANLIYENESGALNESFSDIFGVEIEHFARGNSNWIIGEDLFFNGQGIRDMSDPNRFNDPDTYLGDFWVTGPQDNGGVHTNSGVQNFWYYLLVEGGSGVNDNGDAYSVSAIPRDSIAAICYRSLTAYLTPNSGYSDARFYSIKAASDLFGTCSNITNQVKAAWDAVGVSAVAGEDDLDANFKADRLTVCGSNTAVQFTANRQQAESYLWDFGNGETSTLKNPVVDYESLGSYNVSLQLTSCNGSLVNTNSKENYITVVSAGDQPLPPSCKPDVAEHCCGFGPTRVELNGVSTSSLDGSAGYEDLTCHSQFTIKEATDYDFTVDFGSGSNEWVVVYIDLNNNGFFDGESELVYSDRFSTGNSTGVINVTNAVLDVPLRMRVITQVAFINTATAMCQIRNYGQAEDHTITISKDTIPAPVALFNGTPRLIRSGDLVKFINHSFLNPTSYQWTFEQGNPGFLNERNPGQIEFTGSVGDSLDVMLIAENAHGSDTLIKKNYIQIIDFDKMCVDAGSSEFSGKLYDDGADANYKSGQSCSFLIQPDCPDVIIDLEFELFQTISGCCDELRIYDGFDASGDLLAVLNGNQTGTIVTAHSGAMFLQWSSNQNLTHDGFIANWSSRGENIDRPNANFEPNTGVFPINTEISFVNTSTNSLFHQWNFGDGIISNLKNPTVSFNSSGTKSVQLTTGNCGIESDSVVYQIEIDSLGKLQEIDDTICFELAGGTTLDTFISVTHESGGKVSYTINADTSLFNQTQHIQYRGRGAASNFTFQTPANQFVSNDSVLLIVNVNGAFNINSRVDILIGEHYQEIMNRGLMSPGVDVIDTFKFSTEAFLSYIENEAVTITVANASYIASGITGHEDRHSVQLVYQKTSLPDWLNIDIHSNHVLDSFLSDSLATQCSAVGLDVGQYYTKIYVRSNDTSHTNHLVNVKLNVTPSAILTLPDTLDLGDVCLNGFKSREFDFKNIGNTNLIINQIDVDSPFTVLNISDTIEKFTSISVEFAVSAGDEIGELFSESTIHTDAGSFKCFFRANIIHAPETNLIPARLKLEPCDINELDTFFVIENVGDSKFDYHLNFANPDNFEVRETRTQGQTHYFSFPVDTNSDFVQLVVVLNGDYDWFTEVAEIYIEDLSFSYPINDFDRPNGDDIYYTNSFSGSDVLEWSQDGEISFRIENGSNIDVVSGGKNLVKAGLFTEKKYVIPNWFTLSKTEGSVAVNETDTIFFNIDRKVLGYEEEFVFNLPFITDGCGSFNYRIDWTHANTPNLSLSINQRDLCKREIDLMVGGANSSDLNIDLGDGLSFKHNGSPYQHTYSVDSVYNIEIRSCDGVCCDTLVDELTIDTTNLGCEFNRMPSVDFETNSFESCFDSLYDPGGPFMDYPIGFISSTILHVPSGYKNMFIQFEEFSLENEYDAIFLEGSSLGVPIASFSGNDIPFDGELVVIGDSTVVIDMRSDFGETRPGFKLKWGCLFAQPAFSILHDPCSNTIELLNQTIGDTSNVTYLWEFGDGSTSQEINPTHTYNWADNFVIKLTVTNEDGFSVTDSSEVVIGRHTETRFSYEIEDACEGKIQFNDRGSGVFGTTYQYNFGDGSISEDKHPLHTYQQEGIYDVSLKTCIDNCCDTAYARLSLDFDESECKLNRMPSKGWNIFESCLDSLYDFGGSAGPYDSNSDGYSLLTLPNGVSGMFIYFKEFDTEAGTDIVELREWSVDGPLIDQFSGSSLPNAGNPIEVDVNGVVVILKSSENVQNSGFKLIWGCIDPIPDVNLGFSLPEGTCAPRVQFNNLTTGDTIGATYFWEFGDGNTSEEINPMHFYQTGGSYNVRLTVTINGYSTRFDSTINLDFMEARFVAPFIAEVNEQIEFKDLSQNVLNYTWDFGNGLTSTDPEPTTSYAVAGGYIIRLEASNANCNVVLERNIQIDEVTSIADVHSLKSWSVYPNPATTSIYVDITEIDESVQFISILNADGKAVLTRMVSENGVLTLPVKALAQGMYIIKITSETKVGFKHIIIE